MNRFQLELVDLVSMAETPLYSSYAWLGKRLGRPVALDWYLEMIDKLVVEDVLACGDSIPEK